MKGCIIVLDYIGGCEVVVCLVDGVLDDLLFDDDS